MAKKPMPKQKQKQKQKQKTISEPFVDSGTIRVSDILVFFKTYPKKYNYAANLKRESILEMVSECHTSFLTHPEFGDKWLCVQTQWMNVIDKVSKINNIPNYTRVEVERTGGRGSHSDFKFWYYDGDM